MANVGTRKAKAGICETIKLKTIAEHCLQCGISHIRLGHDFPQWQKEERVCCNTAKYAHMIT